MGSFVFTWPNAAREVYVTGTFDNWSQSTKLDKVDGIFQKTVELPDASSKIYYKFVVDGDWVVDTAAPHENDASGNINNVLTPENIVASAPAVVLSSAAPTATTAELAKDVPLEEKAEPVFTTPVIAEDSTTTGADTVFIASAAPTSTTAELLKDVPLEKKAEPVEPAEPTETAAAATEEPSKASEIVAPVAAAAATAAAGAAAVGAAVTAAAKDTVANPAMTDSSDIPGAFPETPASDLNKEIKMINPLPAAPGGINPVKLAPGEPIPESLKTADINANVKLDPESYEKADAAIVGDFSAESLPPVSNNMIPESSLPIVGANDVHINSAAPVATTAALAGAVPLEEKAVPAGTSVAAANVPEVVAESQKEAGVAPEASAVAEEVKEKEQVEEELLQKVPEAPATSEGETSGTATAAGVIGGITAAAAGLGAVAYATATSAKDKAVEQATPALEQAATNLPVSVKQHLPAAVQEKIATTTATGGQPVTTDIPEEVKESFQASGTSPEAAANTVAVSEKKVVESELLSKVATVESAGPAVPAADGSAEVPSASIAAPVVVAETAEVPSSAAAVPVAAAVPIAGATTTSEVPSASAAVVEPIAAPAPVAAPASVAASAPAPAPVPAGVAKSSVATPSPPSTVENKKKNRLSGFFHKLFDSKKK